MGDKAGHTTSGELWTVVLAGGEGRRLHSLSIAPEGRIVPKQFCSFCSDRSLLARTLERAERLSPPERILVVVAADHRRWWEGELSHLPAENVVVQPRNRGTAAGLLLPSLRIMQRDRDATLVVLPSDHDVRDESGLLAEFDRAVAEVHRIPHHVVVLGMAPDGPDTEYGWIVPGADDEGLIEPVERFVEKPPLAQARRLLESGAAWSSFMLVSRVGSLLDLFGRSLPELERMFRSALTREDEETSERCLEEMYRFIPTRDFSREVLEPNASRLRVLRVPDVGWSDLGTPDRLQRALRRRERDALPAASDPWEGLAPRPVPRSASCPALESALEHG